MSCHWSVLHSRKILLFTTPNCRCSIGSLCFPHCTDLSTRITGIYSCQQPPREMLRTCTTEWSIESNKTWLVQCSDWNQIPDSLLFIDFFSNFFDILVGTTCWRAPRMRMIFNAHFPSFEPHKPLKNLHTAQCFLLMGLLKHFVCFCGRFSETETKFQTDLLFSMVRHNDFASRAWQHLGELTTQARTTFCGDVCLATDSWRLQIHSPSGGTLNYD